MLVLAVFAVHTLMACLVAWRIGVHRAKEHGGDWDANCKNWVCTPCNGGYYVPLIVFFFGLAVLPVSIFLGFFNWLFGLMNGLFGKLIKAPYLRSLPPENSHPDVKVIQPIKDNVFSGPSFIQNISDVLQNAPGVRGYDFLRYGKCWVCEESHSATIHGEFSEECPVCIGPHMRSKHPPATSGTAFGTFGTAGVSSFPYHSQSKFVSGRWVRRISNLALGLLSSKVSVSGSNWNVMVAAGRYEIWDERFFNPALPQAGEHWGFSPCKLAGSAHLTLPVAGAVILRADSEFDKAAKCGCCVPVNFGKGLSG